MSVQASQQQVILATRLREDGLWEVRFVGASYKNLPPFTSRYQLWAKAHALQWMADELYRIKALNTEVD